MTVRHSSLELLAPAKTADFGIEAIRHGADAVYIGGPGFGARAAAGNPIPEIARLAEFAHRFRARVLVALNTILRDDELDAARQLAWDAYNAGADALIVQDMGLLELDLPPIQLHASTQTDNRSLEKVRFLEQVGFSQVVLARELSLEQIRSIAAGTDAVLEFFVHGALCVSYSGLCNISHAHTGRSANRGECSQACRLPYSLADHDGTVVAQDRHLLSVKDNNQSDNLRLLAEAGIRSFKIEGRLKDLSYVKNITAHYRQQLDALIDAAPEYQRASSGRCSHGFVPRPEKSFNRGATDYFVTGRKQDLGAFESPTHVGEAVGAVARLGRDHFEVTPGTEFANGDGLCFFDETGSLRGLRVNRAEGTRLFPAESFSALKPGTEIFRNHDQAFTRLLERPSAQRKIAVDLAFAETAEGFALELCDEDGHMASATAAAEHPPAQDVARAQATVREHLAKLGTTDFEARSITLDAAMQSFVPASLVNALRRDAVAQLTARRQAEYQRPPRAVASVPPPQYPATELSYLGNVLNARARSFYERHGVQLIAAAYETNQERGEVSLMITKHCLRFSFNLCPKQVKGIRPDPMQLINGNDKLTLSFDCKRCEMHVLGHLRKGAFAPAAQAVTIHPRGAARPA